jgi:mannose-1-phosphate guanylyltransferase
MRALLLAGGLGTRLRPLTDRVPKCLVPIKGRPLIDYWFELLLGQNAVERVLVNTHWLADVVREHVDRSPWRDRIDLVHEEQLLGTGGTILANRSWFGEGSFMVAHADNLTQFVPRAFLAAHAARKPGVAITMMAFMSDNPSSCGILECDADGVVQAFHEKVANPPGNLANAAVYIFAPEVMDFLAHLGKPVIDLSTEVLPQFLGRIAIFRNTAYHRDIGTIESLRQAEIDYRDMSL